MKIQISRSTYRVHGQEELTSLKCPYCPKQSIDSVNSYQDSGDIFHRTRTNISNIYTEPQKALHNNNHPEKEERSWRNHAT